MTLDKTKWDIKVKRKNFRPLAINKKGIYGYELGNIILVDMDLKKIATISHDKIYSSFFSFFSNMRFVDRIFRLSPTTASIINNQMVLFVKSDIINCDLQSGRIYKEFTIPDSRKALGVSYIKTNSGENTLVFGEYFDNPGRDLVRIWIRNNTTCMWSVVAEIPAGEIEHVHSVIQTGEDIWILTGDFDHSAAIWKTDISFTSLKPILRGKQTYRCAWMCELGGRLFYATDTQLEENFIYEVKADTNGEINSYKLDSIEGSSIYYTCNHNNCFFSTTVEGGAPSGNLLIDIFDRRIGSGIKSKNACINLLNSNGQIENIISAKKDFLPHRLAQFGTFMFPSGLMPKNTCVAYGVSLEGLDNTCFVLNKV
jgi:hypothetical protein